MIAARSMSRTSTCIPLRLHHWSRYVEGPFHGQQGMSTTFIPSSTAELCWKRMSLARVPMMQSKKECSSCYMMQAFRAEVLEGTGGNSSLTNHILKYRPQGRSSLSCVAWVDRHIDEVPVLPTVPVRDILDSVSAQQERGHPVELDQCYRDPYWG